MKPKVTLINPPTHVLETIWVLWEASKVDGAVPLDVTEVEASVPKEKLEKLFWDVLRQHIPVAEHLHFTFMLEGVSVSLREQMVRHRIGTHVGDNFGVDIVPDLATSSWWSQSMRIQDMGKFADNEMYRIPDTLDGKTVGMGLSGYPVVGDPEHAVSRASAKMVFQATMGIIQDAYNALVDAGVPMEDARELIPLGAQHRISWDINLQALLHVLGKRGCWILQLGIWGPIILGMVEELVKKVHPMFARIVAPPCIGTDDKFKGCQYKLENARRVVQPDGSEPPDHHPPCPLWLTLDDDGAEEFGWQAQAGSSLDELVQVRKRTLQSTHGVVPRQDEMNERAKSYATLWQHDPYTWEPLK